MTYGDNPLKGRTIYAALAEAASHRSRRKKIETLHKYSCANLKTILDYTFNPKVHWLLPEGVPDFKPCKDVPANMVHRLQQDVKKLPIFLNIGPYPNMSRTKRESIFIGMLESIHPDDANLLCTIKGKKLPFDNLTKEVIAEAFPILASKWTDDDKKAKE